MITVLYFAAVRELVGADEERLAFKGTVSELAARLEEKHERLRGRLAAVRFAKNEEFTTMDAAVDDGDVVALIPPVAGG